MIELRYDKEIERLLVKSDALLDGHFILSSGLHSDKYVQCAKFFQYPEYSRIAGEKLAKLYSLDEIDVVIGGAFGGIVIAYAIAQVLGVRAIFAERVDGVFNLRRGFEILPEERVLIAEDVITTGKSIREVMELVIKHNGDIAGVASLIDRNMEEPEDITYRVEWLYSVQAKAFKPEECPLCKKGKIPAIKPGSRGLS
jgi:orotate phosphoribosyltransferase